MIRLNSVTTLIHKGLKGDNMTIKWELNHVGLVVRDIDKTLDYWESLGIFSFEPGTKPVTEGEQIINGKLTRYKIRTGVRVQLGPVTLVLTQPLEGGTHIDFLNKYGEGLHHIAYTVDDMEEERALLVKNGILSELAGSDGVNHPWFDTGKIGNMHIHPIQRQEIPLVSWPAVRNWELHHIGLVVRDIDKTVDYWQSIFQSLFSLESGITNTRLHTDELVRGQPIPSKIRGKYVQLGTIDIELVQPLEGKSPHQVFLNNRGEGIHHIAFSVDDLEKERAKLVEKKIPIILEREDRSSYAYFNTGKVSNLLIELVQR